MMAERCCGKDERMIAAEWKTDASIVRVHDEYYEKEPKGYLAQVSQIVSQSHKRRVMGVQKERE